MKKRFLRYATNLIKKYNPQISAVKMKEIEYGLEGIYLTVTKLIVIIFVSISLGIIKEVILFLIFYNIIRLFAFGMHAATSSACMAMSLILFIGFPYISIILVIPGLLKVFINLFSIIVITLYAPADTHKRPLINVKKRNFLKFMSIFIAIIFGFLSLIVENQFLVNALIFALLIESLLIIPITYKVFNLPYNNYNSYNFSLNN